MRELYKEREKLVKEGKYLRSLAMDGKLSKDKTFEIRKEQTKQYKKYLFINGLIKASEKLGDEERGR